MTAIRLSPAERRQKRADAHHLHPTVLIGSDGLTEPVVAETERALSSHGLIKVRVFSDDRSERERMLDLLSDRLGAAPIQHIGKLLVLWRPLPEEARKPVPTAGAMPRVVKVIRFSKNDRPTLHKVTVLGNQRVTQGGSVKRGKKRMVSRKKQQLG